MEAVRERWTDDRMDDLVHRVDRGFTQVDRQFDQIHIDMTAMRTEQIHLRQALNEKSSRQELAELRSEMNQRFDKLQNMLLTGFLTLVISLILTQIT